MASSQDEVPAQVTDKSESSQDQVPDQDRGLSQSEPDQVPVKSVKSSPTSDSGKITKPKNPGRVAAGKRLAEMNKKNKAMKHTKKELSDDVSHLEKAISWQNLIAVGGLVVGIIGVYYTYKGNKKEEVLSNPTPSNPVPVKKKLQEME